MSLRLNTNVASIGALGNFNNVSARLNKSLERLSTGYKINRAADGAGSLLASEQLRSQMRGLKVANENIQQGVSMLNVADGALTTMYSTLQDIRDVALAASSATVTDFSAYAAEAVELIAQLDNTANSTQYGAGGTPVQLLDGTAANMTIQWGANSGNTLDITNAFSDNTSATLGVATAITDNATADTLLGEVDAALATVAANLATIGGFQNQLSNQMDVNTIAIENYTSAESAIRNVDIAEETSNLTQLQILQQASAFALAQANQAPSIALRLLQ